MVSTLQSLTLLLTVVVPGAVATFGYERHVGPIGRDGTDRLVRYVFGTALMGPFSLVVVWHVWTRVLHVPADGTSEEFENRLLTGESLSPWWLLLPIVYFMVPWALGSLGGRVRTRYYRWIVSGDRVSPATEGGSTSGRRFSRWFRKWLARRRSIVPVNMTGWDYLFLDGGPKLVSVRMRDGKWIGGLFGPQSFASPPAASQKEMVLEARVQIDSEGSIVLDELGTPFEFGGSVPIWAIDVDLIVVNPS